MEKPAAPARLLQSALLGAIALGIVVAVVLVATGAVGPRHHAARAQAPVRTSPIWHPGTRWDITVSQDSSAVAADGQGGMSQLVYHFELLSAPRAAHGDWVVVARQDGAEGPFAEGYRLYYREAPDGFRLRALSLGTGHEAAASFARGIVGDVFPLQLHVTAAPRTHVEHAMATTAPGSALPPPLPN